ncbi:MAG: DUF1549 and DUF1553 domain-containing protein [Verrucomicrobiales bacterium]
MPRSLAAIFFLLFAAAAFAEGDPVSFRQDVMPLLSMGGCNGGGCHGNRDGKGGFKLSLWGESPKADFEAMRGSERRLSLSDPAQSLFLRKATGQVEHEGGERFAAGSAEYRVLRDWIAQGANDDPESPKLKSLAVAVAGEAASDGSALHVFSLPQDSIQLRAEAEFEGGAKRDVTYWAVYQSSNLAAEDAGGGLIRFTQPGETTVMVRYLDARVPIRLACVPPRPDFQWSAPPAANAVDEHVFAKLQRLRLNPSALCTDTEFCRRAYLDIIGQPPRAEEARAFAADPDPNKRTNLIEALVERDEFAFHWALKWADLLRVEQKTLDSKGVAAFHGWIRQSIAEGKPLDQFCREIVTASGSTYENPPSNFYRALREPALRSEAVAQVFLGTRINCAKCHNHPFERWTQDDYYRFAALFDAIDYEIVENKRKDKFDKHQFIGEQRVKFDAKRELKDPRTKSEPDAGLLEPEAPAVVWENDRFAQAADWMFSPDHPRFARVQANRIWAHLLGRGIVDPPDDFRATNPPSNPALLDALTAEFAGSGFDLRHLIRLICQSATYQLSAAPNDSNAGPLGEGNFARAAVGRISAEALLDATYAALGTKPDFAEDGIERALHLAGATPTSRHVKPTECDRFLALFGKPPRLMNSDTERSNATSLAQVFALTSGRMLHDLLRDKGNALGEMLGSGKPDGELIDDLCWRILSRPPSEAERAKFGDYLLAAPDRRAALEDIAWALLNAKEFMFRR